MRALARSGGTMEAQATQPVKLWRNGAGAAIRQLCERRYWTRLWVLQELALADGKICIMCGSKQLRWADFTSVLLRLQTPLFAKRSETAYAYEKLMKTPARAMSIQVIETSTEVLLYDQVLAAQHLNCMDPRDQVYGVLSISKATPLGTMRANYDLSLVQVAHRVMQRELAVRPAASLGDVRQRFHRLADAFGVPVGELLSTRELLPAAVTDYPLLHEQTGIDLLWASRLKLWDVVKLWLGEQGIDQMIAALDVAIERRATVALEAIIEVWQEFYYAIKSPEPSEYSYATRCDHMKPPMFLMSGPSTCLDCKDRYDRRSPVPLPPMQQAVLNNSRALISTLLAMDNVCLMGTAIAPSALHVAVSMQGCDHEIIEFLVERTDVNQRSPCRRRLKDNRWIYSGDTPLLTALKNQAPTAVRALLSNTRTDVNVRDEAGNTALYYCMYYCMIYDATALRSEGLVLLGKEDWNAHTAYQFGRTPLHLAPWLASSEDENVAITHQLLEKGLNVNARDEHGGTPLHWASKNRWSLSLLISHGAYVKATDKDMCTPLHCAAESNNTRGIALLLENGADVTARDKDLMTPLHRLALASREQLVNEESINRMVQHGADVNAIDRNGKMPLHYCTYASQLRSKSA